jgi:hypothetical protein
VDLQGAPGAKSTLLAVARHALPTVIEATLVPTAVFYLAWLTLGRAPAYLTALLWGYAVLLRRVRTGDRVPGILVLALIGLTVRSVLALATGSAFVYFAQPIVTTTVVGALFLGSALTERPFVARVAGDFYPMTPEIASRHRVRRLFRRLTVLWAGVNLVNAVVGAVLLRTLSATAFIPTKTIVILLITTTGVVVTVVASLRVARHEGLVAARASDARTPAIGVAVA